MSTLVADRTARRARRASRSGLAVVMGRAARTPRGRVGLALTGLVVLVAAIGPLLAPYSPTAFVSLSPYSAPTSHLLLGSDTLGRDTLSRVLDGGWVLLLMASAATAVGVGLGAATGVAAAYLGGKVDAAIMRTVDVILSFPQLVFALLLISIAGSKLWLIVLAVAISHAPQVARVLRSAALDISERPFVKAMELNGVRPVRIMTGEILPSLVTPIVVESGLRLTYSIVVMAGLTFLGFGQQPPAPSWAYMISENRVGMVSNPWPVIVPAALIALLTVGVNTFGDAVARVSIGATGRRSELALASAAVGAAGALVGANESALAESSADTGGQW